MNVSLNSQNVLEVQFLAVHRHVQIIAQPKFWHWLPRSLLNWPLPPENVVPLSGWSLALPLMSQNNEENASGMAQPMVIYYYSVAVPKQAAVFVFERNVDGWMSECIINKCKYVMFKDSDSASAGARVAVTAKVKFARSTRRSRQRREPDY